MYDRGVAQLASAPGLGPGGRRFKSFHPDHSKHMKNFSYEEFFCLYLGSKTAAHGMKQAMFGWLVVIIL